MPVFQVEEKIAFNTWGDIVNRSCCESPVESQKYRYVCITAVSSSRDSDTIVNLKADR